MISPSYDQKVLYQISLCSGLVAGYPPSTRPILEEQLYTAIQSKLGQYQKQLGAWEIVWGPIVLLDEYPVGQADNSMYVAQYVPAENNNPLGIKPSDPPLVVVAVAGTNPTSIVDWLVNDDDVKQMISWRKVMEETTGSTNNTNAPKYACISKSTHDGLVALLTVTPGIGRPQAGHTLVDFLSGLQKPIELTTTGHSKGGALSSTLALWLKDSQSEWDKEGQAEISSMPTAGPTAGNSAFAKYSDQTLTTVTRFANRLDIVPHAWNQDTLEEIKTLYEPDIKTKKDAMVNSLVECAKQAAAQGGDYTQLQSDPLWRIEGTIRKEIILPSPPVPVFANFSAQAVCQHTGAYDYYFRISGVEISPFGNQFCKQPTPIIFPAKCRQERGQG